MEDYGALIRSVFEMGSIRDAQVLFELFVKNAFPTNDFRKLEVIRFIEDGKYMEGRSWNHVFEIQATEVKGNLLWDVHCQRVTMGKAPEKQVYLDYRTLGFVQYP